MPASRRRAALEEVSDEALMRQYVDGDAEAFSELFRRYEPRAFSYFLKRTRSCERARDLYQDLFLRVHRARDSFDPARAFAPWFFQIAQHLLVDDQRRAYRSQEIPIGDRETSSDAFRTRDDASDRERVGQILDSLSAEERYVLVSAKVEGIGYPELAARLGKSADAVKQLASRAMRRLRAAAAPAVAEIGEAGR